MTIGRSRVFEAGSAETGWRGGCRKRRDDGAEAGAPLAVPDGAAFDLLPVATKS